MARILQYSLQCKLKAENGYFFGPGPASLLTYIRDGYSLHQAASEMNMAYSKAWRIMNQAEKELGFPLIVRTRGGRAGGGSTLTKDGASFLKSYLRFVEEMHKTGDALFQEIFATTPFHQDKGAEPVDILR